MKQLGHCIVLGAGLMGRLLAHSLARLGYRVDIHESQGPEAEGSAAYVAAAMLAPLAESAITELPIVQMGQHSLIRWPQLLQELNQAVFFQQNGTLIVWHRQDAAEAKRFEQLLERTQSLLTSLPKLQSLDKAELVKFEPALEGRFQNALYLPHEGQLDNRELLAALMNSLQTQKVNLHWNSPKSPEDFSLGTAGQPDYLFDCRGLGARHTWTALRGVRGEVIRLHAPEVTLQRPTRLIHPRYPLYIAPKENHIFVIGATEIETEDLSPASVRSTLELLSAAYTVHSGFAEARILEIKTQARPTLKNNLPSIRQLGPRCLQINGLYRHGFLIAPAMLDIVLEWLQTKQFNLADKFSLNFEYV